MTVNQHSGLLMFEQAVEIGDESIRCALINCGLRRPEILSLTLEYYKAVAVAVLLYLSLSPCLQWLTILAFAVALYTELHFKRH